MIGSGTEIAARGDFVDVFSAGKFETNEAAGWEAGDWNGDSVFDTGEFVAAFTDGGFEQGPRRAVASVPEPACGWMLMIAGMLIAGILIGGSGRRR